MPPLLVCCGVESYSARLCDAVHGSMGHRHIPLLVNGRIVGDLVAGEHGVSFYSIEAELRHADGLEFASKEIAAAVVQAMVDGAAAHHAGTRVAA